VKITTTLQTQAKTYSLNLRDDDDTTQIIAVLGNRINTIKTELENIRSQKENATVQFESNLKNYDFLREIALLSAVLKKKNQSTHLWCYMITISNLMRRVVKRASQISQAHCFLLKIPA